MTDLVLQKPHQLCLSRKHSCHVLLMHPKLQREHVMTRSLPHFTALESKWIFNLLALWAIGLSWSECLFMYDICLCSSCAGPWQLISWCSSREWDWGREGVICGFFVKSLFLPLEFLNILMYCFTKNKNILLNTKLKIGSSWNPHHLTT